MYFLSLFISNCKNVIILELDILYIYLILCSHSSNSTCVVLGKGVEFVGFNIILKVSPFILYIVPICLSSKNSSILLNISSFVLFVTPSIGFGIDIFDTKLESVIFSSNIEILWQCP